MNEIGDVSVDYAWGSVLFEIPFMNPIHIKKTPIPSLTYAAQWLESDCVVTILNYRQHCHYTLLIICVVTVLQAVVKSDYTVTLQSLCSHCAA